MFLERGIIMKNLTINLQHTIPPSPIKEIVVEHERSDLYKGFLVLEDGTKIQSNYGCIGMRCFGASGKDRQEVMDGWKKELEKFWFSRKLAVLVA